MVLMYVNLLCNLKMRFLKAIKGKLLKSTVSSGKNTQYAEKHLELILLSVGSKGNNSIDTRLVREICQILF